MSARLAAALTFSVFAAGCAPAPRGDSAPTVRVMTYNIQAGGGGLEKVAAVIRDLRPDIVGLQEVDVHWSDRSRFADLASELATALHMRVSFAPIYSLPGADASSPVRKFGVALLSRFPIVEERNDSLTRLSTQEPNAAPARMPGLLDAILDVGGRHVRVLVTHLDYRADPVVRAAQVTEIVGYVGGSSLPTILVGDLNATPAAAELQPLFQVLHDSWRAGAGFTYPAGNPQKRIDYVLASTDFKLIGADVPSTLASDHRPVVVELKLQRR